MHLLSKSCEYGLRATIYVAGLQSARDFVPVHEIAKELGISFSFLTKVLQKLVQAGLLRSARGPRGGVALCADAPHRVVMELLDCLDGRLRMEACLLGIRECSQRRPCPIQMAWQRQRSTLFAVLENTSLADLSALGFREQLNPNLSHDDSARGVPLGRKGRVRQKPLAGKGATTHPIPVLSVARG